MPARISLPGNRFLLIGATAALLCLGVRVEARDVPEFHCFLRPVQNCSVPIGDTVQIHFEVDSTAVQFNGYELTLQYDPTALEFIGIMEGALMTSSCATRFQSITTTDSTVTFSHVTLCAGVSLDGPGRLSSFRFEAISEAETEVRIVSNPDRLFVDAGLWVWPGHSSFPRQVVFLDDGTTTLCVWDPSTVGPGGADDVRVKPDPIGLRLFPNPARDTVRVDLSGRLEGAAVVDIVSAAGRRIGPVRSVADGRRELLIPLRDPVGTELPAGSYYVRARSAKGVEAVQRLVVVR